MRCTRSCLGALAVSVGAVLALAAPGLAAPSLSLIDGVRGEEWDTARFQSTHDAWVGPMSPLSPLSDVPRLTRTHYLHWDSDYVYLAFEADPSDPDWSGDAGAVIEAHLYSGGYDARRGDGVGSYGDGDDLILRLTRDESGDHWGWSLDGSTPTLATAGQGAASHTFADLAHGIVGAVPEEAGSLFFEAALPRELVGFDGYRTLHFGGRAWAEEFTYDVIPVVPTPAAVWMGLALLGGVAGAGGLRRLGRRARG